MSKVYPIRGISIINPDDVEKTYYEYCIDYAIKANYNHIQITGPIHNPVKGNIDGMTFSVKYSQFNDEKDAEYIKYCQKVVNEGLERSNKAGIKTFMWHHELDLPRAFTKAFPQVLNENGDIEVSHPIVKDYLENKIIDFFEQYPKMDGIVLTLHETKIPLLKLKNQKLDKIERVKYVTEILYNVCQRYGKEMIVRPFASLAKDQTMMLKAFAEISPNLFVMDKWTKYDWSLSLPDNDFFNEIERNPYVIETDIFGEYFGKGRLPIMFKEHIEHKYSYCEQFPHQGFVNRIDRNYQHPFGSVNEVNLVVMQALSNNLDVEKAVKEFFDERYGEAAAEVREVMERTEANQKKIFYMNGYYFTQGSYFPEVNHCKNHFFFEIMKDKYEIASNEWFIPVGWKRISIDSILTEKEEARQEASEMLAKIKSLENKMPKDAFDKILLKFVNLDFVAKLWYELIYAIYDYSQYFEKLDDKFEKDLFVHLENIDKILNDGRKTLGEDFYAYKGAQGFTSGYPEFNGDFVGCMKANFDAEKQALSKIQSELPLTDYIICGGISESHKLQKEVNFSDTLLINGKQCRIPGNKAGMKWSLINAHGWFSYELKTTKNTENTILINFGTSTETLNVMVTIGDQVHHVNETLIGEKEYAFNYTDNGDGAVRIRIDRVDANTPIVYTIKVR